MSHVGRVMLSLVAVCAVASPARAQFIDGEYHWLTAPDSGQVGDCFGNCGAGCGDFANPCDGPPQYWEWEYQDTPVLAEQGWQGYVHTSDGHIFWATLDIYHVNMKWTYHGWAGVGCYIHDAFCGFETFYLCWIWAGCGSTWEDSWDYTTYVTGYTIVNLEYWGSLPGSAPGILLF